MEEKEQRILNTNTVIKVQVIRDILIENGLTTNEDFKKRITSKIESSRLSEEVTNELLEMNK